MNIEFDAFTTIVVASLLAIGLFVFLVYIWWFKFGGREKILNA
jgi:hypothetical protein